MAAKWSFHLVNSKFTKVGEVLNATERKAKLGIRQLDTASFKIRADNDLFLPLYAEDTYLQVYQDHTLRFYGPVITPEFASDETGGTATIVVNAISPGWYLTKRLTGKSPAGTTYTAKDKADTAKQIIDANNAEAETHVETTAISSGSIGTYTAGPYKKSMACIKDLATGFDGFDWKFTPLEEKGTKLARFDAAAVIGSELPDIVFEYGCGKHNMRSMTFKRDISNLLNLAYHITDNGPTDPLGVISVEEAVSREEHGLFEEVVESAGLFDEGLRKAWARENVNVRGVPRLIATMTSDLVEGDARTPEPFTDYSPGDLVVARARTQGIQLFDAFVRCYNVEVSVDESGTPIYTPTIVEEEGEGAEEA